MIQPQEHRRKETQGQWSRLLWLDRAIRDQRYPNVHHLQDEFGVSRRTAFHTVGFLRGSLGAPVRYSKRRGGYYYEDPTYGLPTVFLQEGELLALLLAEQVTNQYLGTPMEAPLRAAVGKITRYLPEEVRVELSEVADIFRFGGASSMEVPLGLMLGVQRAIRERRVLRILYYTASRDETRERDVDPHFLTNVRGDWMLVAWDHWRERDAVFMLARIQEFQMLERVFSRRPELNPQHYSQHTFLTEHGAEPYEVVLRFDSYQARWIRERRWHPGQQVKEQEDGGLILRMTVAGVGDLTRWILGYGSHVEVLAPDWLRGDVASECGRAARIYRDHQHYKDMDEERLLRIWAKTDKQDETAYHPLLFHLLDVAAVARSLWDLWLPAELKLRVGAALGLDEEQARVAVVILAGMHDLGKACPAFQRQVGRLFERLGLPDTDFPSLRPLHGFVSAKELIDRYGKSGLGWRAGTEAAYCLAAITGGHHGVFPGPDHLGRLQYKVAAGSEEKWTHARERLIQEFLSAAAGEAFAAREVQTPEIRDPGIVPILAGLISVADWIGSAQEYFRPAARIDAQVPVVGTYVSDLPKTARKALKGFGWLPNPIAAPPAPINEVFRYIENFDANRMQRTVAQIAESHSEPYLLIVEEAMGRGKSEAAMYAFDRAFSERRTHGLYVALPTMATGNAMFGRVRRYLEERKHGGRLNLQLIYGNALLHEEFAELVFGSVYQEGGDPQHAATAQTAAAEGTVSAAAWFTARKRPLLAPFGVGTIDQSLLGVLQTRHWFVRLFGLAGKVVVFDEIHSYDVYMLTELKLLIRWLRELRCTVILLSATLPSDRRRELVKAWGAAPPFEHKPYPRVTVASEGTAREEHVGEPSDLDRRVGLEFALPEPAGLPNLVRKHLPRGGCGVIICNTVDRAQEVYRTLRDVFKPEGRRVLLFHARMPLAWREKREERVRQLLGKKGDRSQPTLIVGSQVLEQSLDYDADWMASDIAPIDLLIQRMGRLWRHPKENPREQRPTCAPCFTVLCDGCGTEEAPSFGNARVYARYVLLRTWLAIRGRDELDLPGHIEDLIQQVYTQPAPVELSTEWQIALDEASRKLADEQESSRRKVQNCLAPEPGRPRRVLSAPSRDLDDDENPDLHETVRALTRDAEPSITVVCLGTDDQGRPLAKLPKGEIRQSQARELLRFSLPVRNKPLFEALVETQAPTGWRTNAHLRHCRVLRFIRGSCPFGRFSLRLTEDEGLVIQRE